MLTAIEIQEYEAALFADDTCVEGCEWAAEVGFLLNDIQGHGRLPEDELDAIGYWLEQEKTPELIGAGRDHEVLCRNPACRFRQMARRLREHVKATRAGDGASH